MKENIRNKELRERQEYVPASVKVIEVTAQKVLCGSNPNSPEQYGTDTW
ncbi:MAG: hypothetical protein MJZ17_00165 [Bacteroidales bacterium]|nr:hypothetical protein [Bacteroidales bacterium]